MPQIEISNPIPGGLGPIPFAGVPGVGTDEVQTLTIDATGGTFKLAFEGRPTAAITWSAVNATLFAAVDAALEALPNIGVGGVVVAVGTMTAGVGTMTVTFAANLAKKLVATLTVENNSLTGTATLSIAKTTPGVDAALKGIAKGALVEDVTNGVSYVNTGTSIAPIFTKVGTQS